eukprot:354149-Chlamydomonas_euryale.AAC.4
MDQAPRQRHQTGREKSTFGEGRAGAILMLGRVGAKIAAKTMWHGRQAAGGRRRQNSLLLGSRA